MSEPNGTFKEIADQLAIVEAAELTSVGLKRAIGWRIPTAISGPYPLTIHFPQPEGGQYELYNKGGRTLDDSINAQYDFYHYIYTGLIIDTAELPLERALEIATPYIDLVPAAYVKHRKLADASNNNRALVRSLRPRRYRFKMLKVGGKAHHVLLFLSEAISRQDLPVGM